MASQIYTGPWINWSQGWVHGATITLSQRNGGFLMAFLATFVTIVGNELWKIICYILHQVRSKSGSQDGLYHQQQVILRTSPTPGTAAWVYLKQIWPWRRRAPHAFWRTFPWAILSLVYLAAIGVAAIFSSEISKSAGSLRLITSDNCGMWTLDADSEYSQEAFLVKSTNDSLVSATYAKACYGGQTEQETCGKYPVPSITWESNENAACPFASGVCVDGDSAAFEMTSKKIDSHSDLGVNAPKSQRVLFQKRTTCAPLLTADFVEVKKASNSPYARGDDIVVEYHFGPIYGATNETFWYNDHAVYDQNGYTLHSFQATAGSPISVGAFVPVPAINTTDADLSLVFIAANSVWYSEPCEDAVFSANDPLAVGERVVYRPDYWVVPLGCAEQYRVCNPQTDACTPYLGVTQLHDSLFESAPEGLDFSTIQRATIFRMIHSLQVSTVYYATFTRLGSALRASETLSALTQRYLPPNQWHIEVGSWFDAGLARLQLRVQEYAAGPASVPRGSTISRPDRLNIADLPWYAMCGSQLVNDASTTMSFSVLGMSILLCLGVLIIFTSFSIDTVVAWIQLKLSKGLHPRMEWLVTDRLVMQQLLYQEMGQSHWDVSLVVPVTTRPDKFVGVATRELERERMGLMDRPDGPVPLAVHETPFLKNHGR
ncbi:hypothetical protein B0A52_06272 [Exophiala mesophila]|uniref:Uncharacterized protein n=1 Tax=Exophiala mesophila TaxID=212818 RepID=A0A438N2Y3_EXOME|nr:hypothetical protein B0A52_06272 [Exophiala mesophila]